MPFGGTFLIFLDLDGVKSENSRTTHGIFSYLPNVRRRVTVLDRRRVIVTPF